MSVDLRRISHKLKLSEMDISAIPSLRRSTTPLSIPQSAFEIFRGFSLFNERIRPTKLLGVRFERVAGQAFDKKDLHSREAIRRNLLSIKQKGAFLILGHGGEIGCGAIKGKQNPNPSQPQLVKDLVEHISERVIGLDDLQYAASIENALFQGIKILHDPEFAAIIKEKDITVVYAVCNGDANYSYNALNKGLNENALLFKHPKLQQLREQFQHGLAKVSEFGIDLKKQYAYAAFGYDPAELASVIDKYSTEIELGGVCCVDSRLPPHTGVYYLLRIEPNEAFSGTFHHSIRPDGVYQPIISKLAAGSIEFGLQNVCGINSLNPDNPGNGHLVMLATSLANARKMKETVLQFSGTARATKDGKTISLLSFDGKELVMQNDSLGFDLVASYDSPAQILTRPPSEFAELMDQRA
ncbi:MAG: hypothetical protein AABX38_07095 [Candidatus Micrarchaeota archaeon]